MATSTDVLYNFLSRLFCCSKGISSSQKKLNLENFAIDSEFSDAPSQIHSGHAFMASIVKESNAALTKEAPRKGHHPYERARKSSPKKSCRASLRSQSISADKELLGQLSGLSCGEGNELHARSILSEHESNAIKAEDDGQGRNADAKALEKEQEHCRRSADSCVRSTTCSQFKMDDWEGTADTSEYTRNLEGIKAAVNDPGDIIGSYKDPNTGESLGTEAISNAPNRESVDEMEDRKAGLVSMETFLVSKQYCESSSEDVESETEVSYAVDFHDRKTFNKILSRRMLAFIKFRQNNTRKQP